MNRLPAELQVRVHRRGGTRRNVRLPLFLLWPAFLVLAMIVLPAVITVTAMLRRREIPVSPAKLGASLWRTFCALPGLVVEVVKPGENVFVSFR